MKRHQLPLFFLVILFAAPPLSAQTNKIPPLSIDEWFNDRFFFVVIAGIVAGVLVALLWLSRLLPIAHRDDNQRARKHFFGALILVLVLLSALILADITTVAEFGRRSYDFKDLFSQVFLTWRTFLMLLIGALCFTAVIAVLTRFSRKPHRYMLLPFLKGIGNQDNNG